MKITTDNDIIYDDPKDLEDYDPFPDIDEGITDEV